MAKNSINTHVYADGNYAVWTAAFGTAPPTTLPPTNPGAGFYEVGLLDPSGIVEAHTYNESKIYDMAGALLRIARNQEERTFTFTSTEENAVVDGLRFPGSSVSTSGATAEVQTVAMVGTGTSGTWSLTNADFGTIAGLAYNISTAALVTAILNAWDITVTVTGTAGTSYVITFPAAAGNVPQSTAGNNISGVSAINVTTTTPGVTGVNTRTVGTDTSRNLRAYCIDLIDGAVHKRIVINNGEAKWTGSTTYSSSGAALYQFQLQTYKDSNGLYYTILDDDPASAEVFA